MIRDPISVLLFARYAELLGATNLQVPRASAADVAALVGYLRGLPGGAQLPERPLVAVNMKQVDLTHRLNPGDEVALLPPMAGG